MAIQPGQTLLHFELVEPIGEGGMGVVWRGRDTKLDRHVAIKILPDDFAQNPDRLARFEREAKLLASLNHANIATIHGLEHDAGVHFLAMEMVEGEDLAAWIARGPIPIEEALPLALQIAGALEAAHEQGVIHRDLKPQNIKITPEGTVKILDFGLAKAFGPETGEAATNPTMSPTATSGGTTAVGVILGTAAYMSPEQAKGKPVDRRADIWSFGVVLLEMLTGRGLFRGESVPETLAAVLMTEPDLGVLPATTPDAVRRLIERCLRRDPQVRLRDIGDARLELHDAMTGAEGSDAAADRAGVRVRYSRLPWIACALSLLVAAVALGIAWTRSSPDDTGPLHVSIGLPLDLELQSDLAILALSRDGKRIALAARKGETTTLYVRTLASPKLIELPGTENAEAPFFSPDGEWIGFFSSGSLRKVAFGGGGPIELCRVEAALGASWGADGYIVFSMNWTSPLYRIDADGGEPEPITTLDATANERTHRMPDVLSGGDAILFTIGTLDNPSDYTNATIAVWERGTNSIRRLIEGGSRAVYVLTGHLVYSQGSTLFSVPFDLERREVAGSPTPMVEGIANDPASATANFGVSDDGTLVYLPRHRQETSESLVWVDREGRDRTIATLDGHLGLPRISHDGKRIAVLRVPAQGEGDPWVHDLSRGTWTRLTFDNANLTPAWSPDGSRIAYSSVAGGEEGLYWTSSDGAGTPERIAAVDGRYYTVVDDWNSTTDTIAFTLVGGEGGADILTYRIGDDEADTFLASPASEGGVSYSPDGRWLAYVSDESGRRQIYVRSVARDGGKWQLSTAGGRGPRWSPDGREIFYTNGRSLMAVPVEVEPAFSPGAPAELFRYRFARNASPHASDFDVAPDGRQFVFVRLSEQDAVPPQLTVITDFTTMID